MIEIKLGVSVGIGTGKLDISSQGSQPSPPAVPEYYKVITVDHAQVPSNQTDFPIAINLASDTDLANHAVDGDDIYIKTGDGATALSHEIEFFDPSTGKLSLWFKAPSLSSLVDSTFRMYYGNPAHANSEDPVGVWSNNYEMVVHMNDKTSSLGFADNGIDYPLHTLTIGPAAYYYNGKVYIVWQGPGHDPYITTFATSTGVWATPVQVGTNPLVNDHHGAPGVIVDNSGYIHVFYGAELTPFEYAKSTNPEDISAWSTQTDVGSNEEYPNLVKGDDGTLYLFSKSGGPNNGEYTYRTDADTFVTETTFTDMDANYSMYTSQFVLDSTNDRVHFAFYIWNAVAGQRSSIYHTYIDLSNMHVVSMGGTDMGIVATQTELTANCTVYNSSTNNTQTPALALDSSGNPHIIFALQNGSQYDWKYTYWNGSAWQTPVTIVSTAKYTNWGDIYVSGAGQIEAYLPVSTGGYGSSMEHWRLSGGTWSKVRTVLDTSKYSSYSGGFNYAHTVVNGTDALRWVFCGWALNNYNATGIELFATDSNDNLLPASSNLGHTGQYLRDSTGKGYIPMKSSPNNPTGTSSGQVDGAQDLDGTNDFLRFDSTGVIVDESPRPAVVTIECWLKHQAVADARWIVDKVGSSWGYGLLLWTDGKLWLTVNGGAGLAQGATVLDDNTMRRIAARYDPSEGGTKEMRLYVNGVEDGTADYSTAISYSSEPPMFIGAENGTGSFAKAIMDELRISSVSRSADWLLTAYNIEKSGGAVSLGAEIG